MWYGGLSNVVFWRSGVCLSSIYVVGHESTKFRVISLVYNMLLVPA